MTPEQQAREQIDAMLLASGWVIQDFKAVDFSVGRGIALREVPLKSGPCDYLLLVDRKPLGVVEAKKEGTTLSIVADQSGRYASSLPDFLAAGLTGPLPFLYESTGVETFFRDQRDPVPRSRRVFSFHRPETLAEWSAESDTLRRRLAQMPFAHPLDKGGLGGSPMRDCQVEAITGLEKSFAEDRPRALIHMATGAGKTYTACAFTYRLIKHAKARRVLFLVDRANLGEQARDEFARFKTPDTGRLFTELYNVQHLTSPHIDDVCRVTICTIQRLYSILRGEELAEDADELSGAELARALGKSGSGVPPLNIGKKPSRDGSATLDIAYNPTVPIEKFDFIVTDECHRSIYNLWRQVLEYFDASLIGLTATPAPQTIAYFHQNRVAEYNHERAVTDGVNVGYDVYRIKTKVTDAGGKVDKGFLVDHRSKASRKARQEVLADDLDYTPEDLDRSVVVPDQIRTILRTYRDVVQTEMFPGRTLVPKTLIFAKDDSHAEDIVHLCREVFGKGNDFCKKITHKATQWQRRPAADSGEDSDRKKSGETPLPLLPRQKARELIKEFCLSPSLRIAVTVDMIATGTDVKALEVLIFLRDVRSRVYFEQMKGRGTRVLSPTDLQAVSGEDARAKTRFVIVDAVGVCESDKTESRPLDRQPTVPLKTLLQRVMFPGGRDEDTLTTLAARLARLDRELEPAQRQQIVTASGGQTPATLAGALLRAFDPDEVAAASRRLLLNRLNDPTAPDDFGPPAIGYFDPDAPVTHLSGDLPHWRQAGVTYFVTFRLADSLPQEKLTQWRTEMARWQEEHPEPHDEATRQEFYNRFPARLQRWLDAGHGSCVLEIESVRSLVENALRHFDRTRYSLDEFVVAKNHVHVLVTPIGENTLSEILHSWKSFTAHEILKIEPALRRLSTAQGNPIPVSYKGGSKGGSQGGSGVPPLNQKGQRRDASATLNQEEQSRDGSATLNQEGQKRDASATLNKTAQRRDASATGSATISVWQKESFDHIVRSPASLEKFQEYIRAHNSETDAGLCLSEELRRDAAATLITAACAPFDKPALRQTLEQLKKETEQAIDIYTPDEVLEQGFDAAAKAKAAGLVQAFRDYLMANQAQIDALQIIYSRPYKQRLTEQMLKDLEAKLKQPFGNDPVNTLWRAYELLDNRPHPGPLPQGEGESYPALGATERSGLARTREQASPLPGGEGKGEGERKPSRSAVHRFADLVALVRFALEQQSVLEPFAESVTTRFNEWLSSRQSGSGVPPLIQAGQRRDASATSSTFTPEQLSWLNLIRDHIATSLSIDREDLELSPFNQLGGLGKAHQLFGEQLPRLLDELNQVLAA